TDLAGLVERCITTVSDHGACKAVKVHREFAPGLPRVMLDQDLCEQVFTNLLMNACEAMGEQGGELKIRVQRTSDKSGVMVEIEDSGPGVPPELKEQIFNPFVTTKKTGVGLGLAIVS